MKIKKICLILALYMTLIALTGGLIAAAASDDIVYSYGRIEINVDELVLSPKGEVVLAEEDPYAELITSSALELREAMKNRQPSFELTWDDVSIPTADIKGMLDRMYLVAYEHTGVPNEGDYILRNSGGIVVSYSATSRGNSNIAIKVTFSFSLSYHSTAAMEAQVDAAVEALLAELRLDGKSDYEKVRAIYDWICSHVKYDYTNLKNESYTRKYTTYAALIDRTAVCQGYASLFYRLALEEGIDCRFISGLGDGGAHGWNIVRLNGRYYNLDSTWDSNRAASNRPYEYFLRSNSEFGNHIRDDEYATEEFNSLYPMSDANYNPTAAYVTGVTLDNEEAELVKGEKLTLTAAITPENAVNKAVRWSTSDASVATVENGVVTAVGSGSAVITVTTEDGGFTAECEITVVSRDYTVRFIEGEVPVEGTFYAEISAVMNSPRDGADVLVIAVYKGDEIIDMTYMRAEFVQGQTVTFGGRLTGGEGCTVKAFVLDDLNNMEQISNTVVK